MVLQGNERRSKRTHDDGIGILMKRKKISLVLGCGGIRTLAALPLLKMFKEKNIPLDLIVGTEGGAVMAALFAAGFPFEDFPRYMKKLFHHRVFKKLNYKTLYEILRKPVHAQEPPPAILKNDPMQSQLIDIFKELRMDNLSPSIVVQATSMLKGEMVQLDRGLVSENVYASNVIYPLLTPVFINNQWLASGLYSSSVPTITAVKREMDVIISMSFNQSSKMITEGFLEYVGNSLNRIYTANHARQIGLAISVHNGEILMMNTKFDKSINLWDTEYAEDVILAGNKTVEKFADEIELLAAGL